MCAAGLGDHGAMTRRQALVAALITLVLAVGVVTWRGPGRALVRGSGGDFLVVCFLYCLLTAGRPRWPWPRRALAVGLFAVVVECSQALHLVPPDAPLLLHLTVGATFDPWDFVAYGFGLATVVGIDALARSRADRLRL